MQVKLRRKKNPATNIRVFFRGTVVDRVMRRWLSDENLPANAMPGWVDEILEYEENHARESGDGVVKWKHAGDKRDSILWCKELVTRLEPILMEHVVPYEYQPSRRFKVPFQIPGLYGDPCIIYLVGETDILLNTGPKASGDWHIWDLKGTEDESYWRKTMAQNMFYDLSLEAEMGQATSKVGLIQPMCKQQIVSWSVDREQRAQIVQRITSMAHGMFKKDWSYAEKEYTCSRCFVRHACPRFTPTSLTTERRLSLTAMKDAVQAAPGLAG